ncbi:MAG: DUF1385 domain-containing protein [Clostridia bacterium]|nr:DUF1385 domain-containing protein [Clostridia bacterium]
MGKRTNIGGQAVMEGVMMRSPEGIAIAVRAFDGSIKREFKKVTTKAKKGTFLGWPVVRGVVSFIETMSIGLNTTTRSAELLGVDYEEPSKFEKWLAKVFGTTAEKVFLVLAAVIGVGIGVGLFMFLPTLLADLTFGAQVSSFWKSLTAGAFRLTIFIGYLLLCSAVKDVRRMFMYHGAEHKTIACYEAEEELTPENAARHTRLHPRCGTNYMFLVMAISILFFSVVGWSENKLVLYGTRLLLLPVIAGVSYEVLQLAAKHDNWLTKIIRAPGMGLQIITTREPERDMLEVAIAAFELALDPPADSKPAAEVASAGAEEAAEPVLDAAAQTETRQCECGCAPGGEADC